MNRSNITGHLRSGALFVLAIALVALLANGCFGGGGAPGVDVSLVHKKTLDQTITVAGSLGATNPVDVIPKVSGMVNQVLVPEGAEVVVGQTLVTLEDDELEQSVLSAKASKESANALSSLTSGLSSSSQSTAEAVLALQESMAQIRDGVAVVVDALIPLLPADQQEAVRRALEEYEKQAEQNQVDVSVPQVSGVSTSAQNASANKAIENAQENLENATILSPADGTLIAYSGGGLSMESLMGSVMGAYSSMIPSGIDLTTISGLTSGLSTTGLPTGGEVEVGSYVTPGQPIYTVADLNQMTVSASVDETDIGKVMVGQSARVTLEAYPEEEFTGQVVKIANVATTNEAGATAFDVEIEMDRSQIPLKIGMSATAEVVVMSKPSAIAVPLEAVMEKEGKKYVFRVVDGKAKMTQVKVGLTTEDEMEILEGVESGDRIVTKGVEKVKDGQSVE